MVPTGTPGILPNTLDFFEVFALRGTGAREEDLLTSSLVIECGARICADKETEAEVNGDVVLNVFEASDSA